MCMCYFVVLALFVLISYYIAGKEWLQGRSSEMKTQSDFYYEPSDTKEAQVHAQM